MCCTIHPTEAQFQEVLNSIQEQPWYVNNAKFRSYLESEWLTCIPVCVEYHIKSRLLFTYMYIYTHTAVGSCISASVPLWCGHQQYNGIIQQCSAETLPPLEAGHHYICSCTNISGSGLPRARSSLYPSYSQANKCLPET